MVDKKKVIKVRTNQSIHINALKSAILKGAILTRRNNGDTLSILLDSVSDKDISETEEDNPLVLILEIEEEKKNPKKDSKDPEKKKENKKSNKTKKKGDK